ncbi:MAG: hypothetical protein L7F77_14335, partial [Candidatus Magnetominusculus sp. LBB02]|nr:hypothetical protein [Candidatus Magnetominusculus sp. LBB02]
KAEGPILERKAAEKAEKAATDAEKATVNPEKKVTEEAAKTEKEIGKWYDEAENYKWDPSSVERKKANIVDTGKISADEVKKTNQVAEQAAKEHAERALEKAKKEAAKEGRQLTKEELDLSHYEKPATKINAYKTEASQWDIEHSIEGHAEDEVKKKIADERAKYERVSPKYATPEADRGNMPLKKEDYQNIEKYRKQAVDAGTLEFPHKVDGELAKVKYMVKQDDGVICIRYRVDPINGKMTFETMWKEQYKNR